MGKKQPASKIMTLKVNKSGQTKVVGGDPQRKPVVIVSGGGKKESV